MILGPSGNPGDSSSTKAILENKTDVYTFTANDFVTWSLSGGTDKGLFSINSSTGALTFNSAPDYESPADSNKDNSYVVDIRATDSLNNYVDQTVSVLIADVDELTSSPIYSIYTDINVPQENYLLTTTAQTSNVAAGTKLYWSLSGTNINLADFSSGSMNGEGTVGNDGSFSFQHLLANDGLTEGYETIDIKLFSDNSLSTQLGITKSISENLFNSGVDVITSGNHVWDQKETAEYINTESRLLRPLNLMKPSPGKGFEIFKSNSGFKVGVLNLMGNVFMKKCENVFEIAKSFLLKNKLRSDYDFLFVDFHGEITSEKMAMGHFFDVRQPC